MNIYVGNLSRTTNQDSLKQVFEGHGGVESVRIMTDKFTGEPRGFGFVTMPNDDEARAAIGALDGYELDGRRLRVNEARPQEQRPHAGGGAGAGRFPRPGGSRGGFGGGQGGFGGGRGGSRF